MNRTEAPSAQCKSSTTSSCGRPAASAATSQYRPWRTPNDGSASPGGAAPSGNTIGAASAAAPANAGRAPRPTCRAAAAPAAAAPPPTRTRAPTRTREPPQRRSCLACAASRADTRRLVLPIPAGPSTTTTRPAPAATSSTAPEITPRSRSRSWSRPIMPGRESMAAHARSARRAMPHESPLPGPGTLQWLLDMALGILGVLVALPSTFYVVVAMFGDDGGIGTPHWLVGGNHRLDRRHCRNSAGEPE